MAFGPINLWQTERGKVEAVSDIFSWTSKSLQTVTAAMKFKGVCSLEEKL